MKTENRRSEPSAGFATSTETAEFLKISKSLVNKLVAEGADTFVPIRTIGTYPLVLAIGKSEEHLTRWP
jgi:hypothetical protein